MGITDKVVAVGLVGVLGFATAPAAFAAIDEQEPNNNCASANTISVGTTVYGVYDKNGGDFYRINLPANSTIKIRFANDEKGHSSQSFGLSLYDRYQDYDQALGNFSAYSLKPRTVSVNLSRGSHYLRVAGPQGNGLIMLNNPPSVGHSYHFKLSYVIPGTSMRRAVSGTRAFTASWVGKSGAAYYQLRYTPVSTYGLYGWDAAKTKKVSASKASAKIGKLNSSTKYYVQVRVAKKIAGKTYYSSWTGKKSVTTR